MKIAFKLLIVICLILSISTYNHCKKDETSLPELVTVPASLITSYSALLGGQIGNDGGAQIISRGVCWETEPNPDISCSRIFSGKGPGSFTCTLTGLNPNTLYYARAYATNSEGTSYGNEVRFKTGAAEAPTVITMVSFRDISFYSASVKGQITYDGGAIINEHGICWATIENPTINDEKEISTSTGYIYSCNIGPLQPKSLYYARAYAINCADTSYGDNVVIETRAVPEVTTGAAIEITGHSATVGGVLVSIGDAIIGEMGICYGIDKDPTTDGPHIITNNNFLGEFGCDLTNLTPGTQYYARTYVSWDERWDISGYLYTVYGNEVAFTTENQ